MSQLCSGTITYILQIELTVVYAKENSSLYLRLFVMIETKSPQHLSSPRRIAPFAMEFASRNLCSKVDMLSESAAVLQAGSNVGLYQRLQLEVLIMIKKS